MVTRNTDKVIATITHNEETRKNIPTAEFEAVMRDSETASIRVAYEHRNRDLDPQLVWRGKDEQDWSDLVVNAPPLYIQDKVHPKALIDDLLNRSRKGQHEQGEITPDLFSDFDGIPKEADKTEFYQHDQNWANRMILGDSLQVMASLSEREGLRGKVQCIYFDPPYGIKFNSNFQWSTTSRDVKDGKVDHITREPEQVKAFRDTWRDGIHSYLTYLRDRLKVARDLLKDSGCIFVQISDENTHHVREVLEEVFGAENRLGTIIFRTTTLQSGDFLPATSDYLLWFAKSKPNAKFHQLFLPRQGTGWVNYDFVAEPGMIFRKMTSEESSGSAVLSSESNIYRRSPLTSTSKSDTTAMPFKNEGRTYSPGKRGWSTNLSGLNKLYKASRLEAYGETLSYRRFVMDFPCFPLSDTWTDTATGGYADTKTYVVQSNTKVIQRCILMATDPGDLVLDPTCGSGTTATVSEQWGRRWITIDTSRVALALARARIMGARYPFYLLADSRDGQIKEAEVTRTVPSSQLVHGNIQHGFVYERVPHVTLKSIANNAEIDVIWDRWQPKLDSLRDQLNNALITNWQEWEVPRQPDTEWPNSIKKLHADWWLARIARQQEIDKSIGARAEFEYLYDKPYEDKKKVRVAGPFTVESLSPHRTLTVDENDDVIIKSPIRGDTDEAAQSFTQMILANLKTAGVQQAHKVNKIQFISLQPWAGQMICAEGEYVQGDTPDAPIRRAGIFIGPEFGTVNRADLVEAAREAMDVGFDVLITCAFNYDAHTTEFNSLGRIPVLKARMNADLHMSEDLKNTGKGNLFVVFGEPDINLIECGNNQFQVKINGVDVFHPQTGEVRSDGPEGIACWMLDTDYNEESFFVRHAYFLGANDPYGSLKTSLKAEINKEVWDTLNSDTSRPFDKPKSGRIAVKVINHLGDEVMKIFKV